jgi:hypothetical protein
MDFADAGGCPSVLTTLLSLDPPMNGLVVGVSE